MWGESKMRGDDFFCSMIYWIKILSDLSGVFNFLFIKGFIRDIYLLVFKKFVYNFWFLIVFKRKSVRDIFFF